MRQIILHWVEMKKLKEQIQEDIVTYMNPLLDNDYELTNLNVDDLCQIVVDNFTIKSDTRDLEIVSDETL